MTGKLDLALGDDYGFYPRRAKQVAEARASLGDGAVIDGGAVPITGSGPGEAYNIGFKADGVAAEYTHTLVSIETKEETLAALAAAAEADADVSQAGSNLEVVVLASAGPELTGGYIERNVTQAGGGLVPGEQRGPWPSPHGPNYWLRVRPNGRWQVGWDIDVDPDPDVWRKLTAFLNDSGTDPDYGAEVSTRAIILGWNGSD